MAAPARTLIVDDNGDLRDTVAVLLQSEGHSVIEAADGQLALDALASGPSFDLIILDMMMPVMDGATFLARKAESAHAAITVVVLSYSPCSGIERLAGVFSCGSKLAGIHGLLAAIRSAAGNAPLRDRPQEVRERIGPRLRMVKDPASHRPGVDSVRAEGGRKILVVDDNADAAEMLAEFLLSMGHEVVVAHDGPEALIRQAEFHPDVAVLDLGLPVMDGYELASRLQQVAEEPLRLIALTGYGQDEARQRTRMAGFDAHLIKPIEMEKLIEVIAHLEVATH
jgi:CheY-like chemotaxis protein